MLFAVRIGEPYRPTRDLDLLGTGEPSEAGIDAAVRDIVTTPSDEDGVSFDVGTLQVNPIREENRYGGIRATMQAHLAEARIHVQIDIGGSIVTAAITRESAEELSLAPGKPAWAIIKSSDVMVAVD